MTEKLSSSVGSDVSEIFGLPFAKLNIVGASSLISESVSEERLVNIFTVNVDIMVQAESDEHFKSTLKCADVILADGTPLVWLAKLKGDPLPERVAGSDLVEHLCSLGPDSGLRFFFLGASEGIAEKAAKKVQEKYGTQVVGYYCPQREEITDCEASARIVFDINRSKANVLLVAFGAPIQEKWIIQYSNILKTRVNIGVGATIDFLAEAFPRAPMWMRKFGLEWVFRLIREPRRLWRRYLVRDSAFIWLSIKYLVGIQRKTREFTN